ncbi:MAG: thioredoxin domain-containing protein, partial [Chloroflexia bacterium]|nr:thioredoxin domain-containing protein [Chloroflexia bacterium]
MTSRHQRVARAKESLTVPNHLANETSPYLLQHKDNPVEWYPWGEEALARAQREDKPLLVSIGYASCHWCHVMAHESFEDERTAALMNERFVNVKVDREERPDIDGIYMSAVQAMTGQGGWPLNVFLTPEGVPFVGGTYWPPSERMGMPGFATVLDAVADAWRDRREAITQNADTLRDYLTRATSATPEPGALNEGSLDEAFQGLQRAFDDEHGGFGGAPKFPQPAVLGFLLRVWRRTGNAEAAAMVRHTLDQMAAGGIYDHLGGGFARYAVDAAWLVPHFEKMLYDNAQLVRVYVDAWRAFGDERYRAVAEETCAYVLREMTGPDGGFYSAQDADSEGEEGKFYVWTPEEIDAALPPDGADLVKLHFGVTAAGNFEGKTILSRVRDVEELSDATGLSGEEIESALTRAQERLLAVRKERVPPGTDDKVLTSWNGLMIGALAEAGRAFDRADLIAAAARNATFLLTTLRPDGRLLRSYRAGVAKIPAFLEDYAFLADGLLALYRATLETRWLDEARALVGEITARFGHETAGFYDTAADHERLVARPRDLQDGATPAGNSVAAEVLLTFAALTEDDALAARAEAVLATLAEPMREQPLGFGRFLSVLDDWLGPRRELVLAGAANDPSLRALATAAGHHFDPALILARAVPDEPELSERYALLADRPLVHGTAAAYLCEQRTCLPPVTTAAELAALL